MYQLTGSGIAAASRFMVASQLGNLENREKSEKLAQPGNVIEKSGNFVDNLEFKKKFGN